MTIRILLVDDDPLVRIGLRAILDGESDLVVVGEAMDGAEAVSQARSLTPDVVLMDVRMPGVDGIRATELILRREPDGPRVLVVTTFENDSFVYAALRAGASGFLLKRARPEELIRAVRVIAAGDVLLFPASLRALAGQHAGRHGGTGRAEPWVGQLSGREGEVLRLMAAGLTNAEIAQRLVIGVETVKTHVAGVLAKLQARDRTQAVIAAYESGFVNPRS
jgi:DNA-binding NarL/FixJ family response regulator